MADPNRSADRFNCRVLCRQGVASGDVYKRQDKPAPAERRKAGCVYQLIGCLLYTSFFKRLEIYPEMKTERFTAVKRSVLYEYHRICVRRSFMLYCSEIRMKQFREMCIRDRVSNIKLQFCEKP